MKVNLMKQMNNIMVLSYLKQYLYHKLKMLQNPLVGILPDDQADLILIMVISIPLSYMLSFIYNKYLFLALTMALTIGVQSILFPTERWILWGQQQVVYLLVILSPRKYVGHIVFAECFFALTLLHARRLYLSYGENYFDVTGIFMMQLFNYIGLGYNYQNGAKPLDSLTSEQAERRVVQKPSYITYLGYVNFLPACVVGPVYQYSDFENYLNRTGDYANIPNTLTASIKEIGVFLFSLVLYGATSIFPISRITEPAFLEYSLPYKFFFIVLCITHIQLKYVTAWSLGMVSMRASGITYNPRNNIKAEDGSVTTYDFGRIEVNNMTKFYLQPSLKVKVDHWNISVQWALRRYIYQNFYNPKDYTDQKKRKKRQAQAQIYTVMMSALWHGIYPGYFISFIHWVIYIQIAQEVFRLKKEGGSIINRFYKRFPFLYDQIQNLASTFVMTYYGMAFHLMTWSRIWVYLTETYFIPYILLYLGFFLIVKMRALNIFRHVKEKHSHKISGEKAKEQVIQEQKKAD